jgi:type IX secretion system PorP/SprF family membrane protein
LNQNNQKQMNKIKIYALKLGFVLTVFINCTILSAQDIHFTNNRFAPIQFNASRIGGFEGNMRVGGIFRTQFSSFIQQPYKTTLAYADAPLNYKLRKNDWTGIGVQFYTDQAGDLKFTRTGMSAGACYHLSNDAKYTRVLSIGATYSFYQRTINSRDFMLPDPLAGKPVGQDLNRLADFKEKYSDVNLGITYTQKLNKTNTFQAGFAMLYFLNATFNGIKENKTGKRYNSNLVFRHQLGDKKTNLEWSAWHSYIKTASNLSLQLLADRKLSKKDADDFVLKFGLGYRVGDALQILTGASYQNWNIGISYDLTISEASNYNQHNGALELALYKIILFNKKPKVNPIIFCPRL